MAAGTSEVWHWPPEPWPRRACAGGDGAGIGASVLGLETSQVSGGGGRTCQPPKAGRQEVLRGT